MDELGIGFVACFFALSTLGMVALTGATLSEKGNIQRGRDKGIVFCIEKPSQCAVEYKYLKLKETQK